MIPIDVLTRLALADLDEDEELGAEEHILSCSRCSRVLEGLVNVGEAVRALPTKGVVRSFVTRSLVERFDRAGLITRRYFVPAGGRIPCSVGPDDILLLVELEVPLEGVARVDIELRGERMIDVPFDARSRRLFEIVSAEPVRALPTATFEIRALAVSASGEERVLGEYALDHSA